MKLAIKSFVLIIVELKLIELFQTSFKELAKKLENFFYRKSKKTNTKSMLRIYWINNVIEPKEHEKCN